MTTTLDTSDLPRDVLEVAVQLRDSLRPVYVTLFKLHKPSTAQEVADAIGHARAYTCMRLNQLVDMDKIEKTDQAGTKLYSIKRGKDSE